QAEGPGAQARRRRRRLPRIPPRPEGTAPPGPPGAGEESHHPPGAAARHRHRHLPPHGDRRRLRPPAPRRRPPRPPRARPPAPGDRVAGRLAGGRGGRDLPPTGRVVSVLERATRTFVGTYFERDGEGLVRVDGTVFSHSVSVGDPGARGAGPDDKVVVEMLRF